MTPHYEAIAFRVWQAAEPVGWNATIPEIAARIDVDTRVVGRVVSAKGWRHRFRTDKTDRQLEWWTTVGHSITVGE